MKNVNMLVEKFVLNYNLDYGFGLWYIIYVKEFVWNFKIICFVCKYFFLFRFLYNMWYLYC